MGSIAPYTDCPHALLNLLRRLSEWLQHNIRLVIGNLSEYLLEFGPVSFDQGRRSIETASQRDESFVRGERALTSAHPAMERISSGPSTFFSATGMPRSPVTAPITHTTIRETWSNEATELWIVPRSSCSSRTGLTCRRLDHGRFVRQLRAVLSKDDWGRRGQQTQLWRGETSGSGR